MIGAPHTSTHKGKRVRVKLKDGTVLIAKFVDRTGQYVLLEGHRIKPRDIKSLSILRLKE